MNSSFILGVLRGYKPLRFSAFFSVKPFQKASAFSLRSQKKMN